MLSSVTLFPQVLINVRLAQMSDWRQNARLVAETNAVEQGLAGQGRVLIRASGTEPVLRVMVEARDAKRAKADAERLAAAAQA
jgi:phosphoglucosamine mutase